MDWTVGKFLVLIEYAQAEQQKVNKHPTTFDANFDIQRRLDHFEYEMIYA